MLCLVGEKYSAHLWPVIELFCWLCIHHGETSMIEIMPLGGAPSQSPRSSARGSVAEASKTTRNSGSVESRWRPAPSEFFAATERSSAASTERQSESSVLAKVRPELARGLRSFSVRGARCDNEEQRQLLLSCVESGFGDHRAFEQIIRSLFMKLLGGTLGEAE